MVAATRVMYIQAGKGAGRQASNSAFASCCPSKVLPIVDPTSVNISVDILTDTPQWCISQAHPKSHQGDNEEQPPHQGWKHHLPDFIDYKLFGSCQEAS